MSEEAQPVNLGGYGSVDMDPDATFEAVQAIHKAGQTFGAAWAGLHAEISAEEQQLGKGPMGRAFRENYNAYEASATPAAENVQELYEGLGRAGAQAVATYLELDGQIVPQQFRSLE
jgi:hypothetical protein